jgi:hypothetical protein
VPTSPTRTTPPPTGPAAPTIARLELDAPSRIAPGESVRLTATIVRSDDSREDVTAQAQWSVSNGDVVGISSAGVATARAIGEAIIRVSAQGRTASRLTFVLPPGTFRLDGRVVESGLAAGIPGVTVTVISGVGEGLTALTTSDGRFKLFGVSGRVRLHAKKEGYVNRIEELDMPDHRVVSFEMLLEQPRPNLTGTYTLTLDAGACSSASGSLPDAARRRSYTASLRQVGNKLSVTLSDADFIVADGHGNGFEGSVGASPAVSFSIGQGYYYYSYWYPSSKFDVVERFDADSALAVAGTVSARETPSGISGTLSGTLQLTRGTSPPFTSFSASCFSTAHGFDMRRQ